MKKSIKTDIFSFNRLREGNHLYVDKTRYVWELVKDMGCYFLSRPRRFGKSLLLSTFEAYFKGRKDLFKGLEIERLAPDVWEEYPVIRLDMTECGGEGMTPDQIGNALRVMLENCAASYEVSLSGASRTVNMFSLIRALTKKFNKPVVILIDEYDKPILDHLLKDDVHDVVAKMREIYQAVKTCNADERFVFVTGVTKFAHTSLFSGANNLTDLTMRREYAAMLGYTEEELRANFAEYISDAARVNEMEEPYLLAVMKNMYDGFRFSAGPQTVYNPVSVGKFFNNNGMFENYWSETGTPSFFFKAAQLTPMTVILEWRGKYVELDTFNKYEVDKLDPFVLAVQTGYLTIKDVVRDGYCVLYKMDFPNDEIRRTFSRFLLGAYLERRETEISNLAVSLRTSLREGDVDAFLRKVKYELKGLAFGNLGDDKGDPIRFYEGYFRNQLALLMGLLNVQHEEETRTADGQVDLVARAGGHRYVFELKCGSLPQISQMAQNGGDENPRETKIGALLDAALEQARRKGYWEKYLNHPQDIQMIALAFDTDTRTLAGWRVERIR